MKYLFILTALFMFGCAKEHDIYIRCQPVFRYCLGANPECIGFIDMDRGGYVEKQDCDEIKVGSEIVTPIRNEDE